MKLRCNICKNEFKPGNHEDGTPNGIGFQKGRKTIVLCHDCICKYGEGTDKNFVEKVNKILK